MISRRQMLVGAAALAAPLPALATNLIQDDMPWPQETDDYRRYWWCLNKDRVRCEWSHHFHVDLKATHGFGPEELFPHVHGTHFNTSRFVVEDRPWWESTPIPEPPQEFCIIRTNSKRDAKIIGVTLGGKEYAVFYDPRVFKSEDLIT